MDAVPDWKGMYMVVLAEKAMLAADKAALAADKAALAADNAKLTTDNATLTTDNATLTTEVADLKCDVASLDDLKRHVMLLKTDIEGHNATIGSLGTDIVGHKATISSLRCAVQVQKDVAVNLKRNRSLDEAAGGAGLNKRKL